MKFIVTLLKRYLLTLLTLAFILCLTFCEPPKVKRTDMIIEIDKLVHLVMYFTLCAVFWYENFKVTLKPRVLWMIIAAVIIPILFSGAMEYLQYKLTLYRTGEFDDFVSNQNSDTATGGGFCCFEFVVLNNTLLFKENRVTDNLAGSCNLCYRLNVIMLFQCSYNLLNGSDVCVDVVA